MNASESTGELPAQIGPYAVVRRLGRGGMGSVYEVERVDLGRRFALKVLHAHLAETPRAVERFHRECRAVAQIHHPHVVAISDVGEHKGRPYFVLELIQGVDLSELMKDRRLEVSEAAAILLPVASAIEAAHAVGIVHRDLKPANILVARNRFGDVDPKVVDFGISKLEAEEGEALTRTRAMLGTLCYMAPEQIRSARTVDGKSDQYAFGVILYEALTGRRPYNGKGAVEMIRAIMTEPIVPPSALVAGLPRGLDEVVLRALDRAPTGRFGSMRELGAALLPFATERDRATWGREFGSTPGAVAPIGTPREEGRGPPAAAGGTEDEPSLDGREPTEHDANVDTDHDAGTAVRRAEEPTTLTPSPLEAPAGEVTQVPTVPATLRSLSESPQPTRSTRAVAGVAALALAAGFTLTWLALRSRSAEPTEPAAAVVAAPGPAPAVEAAPTPSEPRSLEKAPPGAAPTPVEPTPSAAAPTPAPAAKPADPPTPAAKPAAPPTRATRPKAPPRPLPRDGRASRPPEVGDHGAPILE